MTGHTGSSSPSLPSNATIVHRADLTESVAFFRIVPDDRPAAFVPGQYVTVGLNVDERLVQRPYSIASSARRLDHGYELYVRLVPGGALTPHLFRTRGGARVVLRRPKGRFTLRPGDDRTHVFVATGCGLAPFISMLRTLEDDEARRRVVVIHGVSYTDELGYRSELERWAQDPRWPLRYVPTISRPGEPRNAGWTGTTGRAEAVLATLLSESSFDPTKTIAYVCGNPEMTVAADRLLREAGLDETAVQKELYWPQAR